MSSKGLLQSTNLSWYFLEDGSGQFELAFWTLQLVAELNRVEDSTRDVLVQV